MKVWLLQWTFDICHSSHIDTFDFCRQYCDRLIIALNSDSLVQRHKNRVPIDTRENKKKVLESLRQVDCVLKIDDSSPKQMLEDLNIDVFFCWDEYLEKHKETIQWMKDIEKQVVITPRFGNSTSRIKSILLQEAKDDMNNNIYEKSK